MILSPLLVFLLYVLYLSFVSGKSFFIRWIEGCFGLFLALVMSNILKKRFTPGADQEENQKPPPLRKGD